MGTITYQNAGQQPFLTVIRELVHAYQAFTNYDAAGLRPFDLTQSQADVIFTLGNTEGMTFSEIGDHTLITKGTLTGVIDRLTDKGLVKRMPSSDDRRCIRVQLTAKGVRLFQKVFPLHIQHLQQRFSALDKHDQEHLTLLLRKLKLLF